MSMISLVAFFKPDGLKIPLSMVGWRKKVAQLAAKWAQYERLPGAHLSSETPIASVVATMAIEGAIWKSLFLPLPPVSLTYSVFSVSELRCCLKCY
jgi:hypothetical protein